MRQNGTNDCNNDNNSHCWNRCTRAIIVDPDQTGVIESAVFIILGEVATF